MKRKIAVFLLGISMIFNSVAAFADEVYSDGAKKAIVSVKEKITVPSELTEFGCEASKSSDGSMVYSMHWNNKENTSSLYITTDESGNILFYNKYSDSDFDYENKAAKISSKEASEISASFLKKVNPALSKTTKIIDSQKSLGNSNQYTFVYYNFVNDLPVNFQKASISVSKVSGEVLNYEMSEIYKGTFPDKNGIISEAAAKEAYIKEIGFELKYYTFFDNKTGMKVFPAYSLKDSSLAIDAKTSKPIQFRVSNGYEVYKSSEDAAAGSMNTARTPSVELSDAEKAEIEKANSLISDAKAKETAKKFKLIDEKTVINDSRLSSDYFNKNKYIWSFNFENGSFSVDAQTGELLSFYSYKPYEKENKEDKENTLTDVQAFKRASEVIKMISSASLSSLSMDKYSINRYSDVTTVYFPRYYKGHEVSGNGISVSIKNDGSIISYDKNIYDNLEFKEVKDPISSDELFKSFDKYLDFKIMYSKVTKNNDKSDMAIIFAPFNSSYTRIIVDPKTGARLNFDGEVYKEEVSKIEYTDIKGHWCENIVNELLENGYYLEGTEFKPDQEITQLNFLKFILSNNYYYFSNVDEFYENCIRLGIIEKDEINAEKIMTKYECSKIFSRFMGFKEILDKDDIFVKPFEDVTEANFAEVGIMNKFNILNGENNKFNGDSKVTNAETAKMLSAYLNRFNK